MNLIESFDWAAHKNFAVLVCSPLDAAWWARPPWWRPWPASRCTRPRKACPDLAPAAAPRTELGWFLELQTGIKFWSQSLQVLQHRFCVKISDENFAAEAASNTRYKSGFGQNIHHFDEGLYGFSHLPRGLFFYRKAFIYLSLFQFRTRRLLSSS